MRVALASDVFWNDVKPNRIDRPNSAPGSAESFMIRHVSGAPASRARSSVKGTASHRRQNEIVTPLASMARTNSGPTPHARTAAAMAR